MPIQEENELNTELNKDLNSEISSLVAFGLFQPLQQRLAMLPDFFESDLYLGGEEKEKSAE